MPSDFLQEGAKGSVNIEGIGQPSTACFLTRTNVDPINWYLPCSPLPLSSFTSGVTYLPLIKVDI